MRKHSRCSHVFQALRWIVIAMSIDYSPSGKQCTRKSTSRHRSTTQAHIRTILGNQRIATLVGLPKLPFSTEHHLTSVALTPFHSDDSGSFWTSSKVWSTKTFGYAYPEIIDWGVNRSQLTSNVKARINALYNPTGSTSQRLASTDGSRTLTLTPNAMNVQWFANIRLDKYVSSLTGCYTLELICVRQVGYSVAILRPLFSGISTCGSSKLVV